MATLLTRPPEEIRIPGHRTVAFVTLLCALLLTAGCAGGGAGPAGGRRDGAPSPRTVDLRERVTRFTDGITADGGYRGPTRAERHKIASGAEHALRARWERAERELAAVGWTVRKLRDREHGREFAELSAVGGRDAAQRGWGRVYVSLDGGPARWSVQVPHPTADKHSEQLGVKTLLGAPGGVLVLAGAHRESGEGDSADAAHRRDTVFHAVCELLAGLGLPALQVHGFADTSLPDTDAVVSTGHGHEARRGARSLAAALEVRGLRVCRARPDDCGDLEGRTNVQGRDADASDVPFLHFEVSRSVRESDRLTADVVGALAETAGAWAAPDGGTPDPSTAPSAAPS